MTTSQLDPGFYMLNETGLGDETPGRFDPLDRLPSLRAKKRSRRYGHCLALSGGGYRATLFHLGVLRRLNEVGLLGHIQTIACVSGGSIFGALLAHTIVKNENFWPAPGGMVSCPVWESFAGRVRGAVQNDIRSRAIAVGWLPFVRGIDALERRLGTLVDGMTLRALPRRPAFFFCASELERSDYWIFSRHQIGPYHGPFMMVAPDYPLARAVAGSACFPPAFAPQRTNVLEYIRAGGPPVDLEETPETVTYPDDSITLPLPPRRSVPIDELKPHLRRYLRDVHLSDGGVFDNNGVEAIWADAASLVVSDAGGPFSIDIKRFTPWRLKRLAGIQANMARMGQLRWLAALAEFNALPTLTISSKAYESDAPTPDPLPAPAPADARRYPPWLRKRIAAVRTDMDMFSRDEIEILENFGYSEAVEQTKSDPAPPVDAADPVFPPGIRWGAAGEVPWPDKMTPPDVLVAIKRSHRRFRAKGLLNTVLRRPGRVRDVPCRDGSP